jgi:hypothetical protein
MISASLIDFSINLGLGIWVTAIAFGWLPANKDPVKNAVFLARYGLLFKFLSLVLVVSAVINLVHLF